MKNADAGPRIRNATDIAGGLFLLCMAFLGLFLNREYEFGTAAQMGPGYMPLLIFGLIGVLGLLVLTLGLRTGPDPLERWAWREIVIILGAMAAFGFMIERLGLGLSVATVAVLSSLADRSQTLRGILGLTVALVAICWVIFILGLGLNVSFLPPAFGAD